MGAGLLEVAAPPCPATHVASRDSDEVDTRELQPSTSPRAVEESPGTKVTSFLIASPSAPPNHPLRPGPGRGQRRHGRARAGRARHARHGGARPRGRRRGRALGKKGAAAPLSRAAQPTGEVGAIAFRSAGCSGGVNSLRGA